MWQRIFLFLKNLLALIGLFSVLLGGYVAYQVVRSYQLPPRVFALKVLKKAGLESSMLAEFVKPEPLRPESVIMPDLNDLQWRGHGARADRVLEPVVYDSEHRPVPRAWQSNTFPVYEVAEFSDAVSVSTVKAFLTAIKQAQPGQVITLQPGVYQIKARNIEVMRGGRPGQPIMVRAEKLGTVRIELDSQEGFWINAPYWIFENLVFKGMAKNHDYGEHAFHVVGGGSGFVLRNSRLHEFNAMIKGNGHRQRSGEIEYPDGVLIENNHFYNSEIRRTSHPVTFIDVVGGDNWVVRGNLIADFCKGEGDRISYAAFLKGNSSNGVFENNLVVGEYRTSSGVRVGLSLGGGGTGGRFFRNGITDIEHTNGTVRNNILMYCSDVGLYLNKAKNTKVYNNIFYRTMGLDVRFPESSATIENNLLSSRIKERDGGSANEENNLIVDVDDFMDWFKNPDQGDFHFVDAEQLVGKGIAIGGLKEDFCQQQRSVPPSLGAFEVGAMQPDCLSVLGM